MKERKSVREWLWNLMHSWSVFHTKTSKNVTTLGWKGLRFQHKIKTKFFLRRRKPVLTHYTTAVAVTLPHASIWPYSHHTCGNMIFITTDQIWNFKHFSSNYNSHTKGNMSTQQKNIGRGRARIQLLLLRCQENQGIISAMYIIVD